MFRFRVGWFGADRKEAIHKMRRLFVLSAVALLPGCATIMEGTSQSVAVSTTPPGAACTVDRAGTRLGAVPSTPGSLHLDKSKNDLTVACDKEGYQHAVVSESPKFVGTTFGNIIIGGGIGAIVDAASGANYEYPSQIQVDLAPASPPVVSSSAPAPSVFPASSVVPSNAITPAEGRGHFAGHF